jgi:hypothetical protein
MGDALMRQPKDYEIGDHRAPVDIAYEQGRREGMLAVAGIVILAIVVGLVIGWVWGLM